MKRLNLDSKKKGLTIREALKILDGKDKRKLTPKQQVEIEKVNEQLKKTADIVTKAAKKTLQNIKLPTYEFPEIYSPRDYSFLNYEIEGRVEDAKLRKLMIEYYESQLKEKVLTKPEFDIQEGAILFANTKIPIKKDTNQFYICKIISQDKQKNWGWDEVVEEWGDDSSLRNWRVVYNSGKEINKKVAIETGVKDLLIVTKKTITFNPNYL